MTIEANLAEKRKREMIGHANKKSLIKKRCTRPKHHHRHHHVQQTMTVPMALQKLFVSCREVFKGPGTVPPPQDVQKLNHILDNMKPEDLGLSKNLPFFKKGNAIGETPRVTYTTVYKCDNFSLCIFFLPPTAVIPLHNHPGMTVFSKLLLGSMHIKAYDWVSPVKTDDSMPSSQLRLARLKADTVFTAPCNTSVLYPTSGGNIHAFTGVTPCAVLDVLGPPYSKDDGRDCSYYQDFPCSSFSARDTAEANEKDEYGSYAWLEEIEMPQNSKMDGIEYLGPQIIDTSC